jgi:hypothetical protein
VSYAESTCALATHLSRLLAAGPTDLGHTGFEQALLTREVTLLLARDVHRHLTGTGPKPLDRTTPAASTDPITVFGLALADHQRVTRSLSPAEAVGALGSTPAAHEWRHAARHALTADDDWRHGAHPPWTPARAWAALADVAALTEAVTVLDHDLAQAAGSLGRNADARALVSSAVSGLRRAAVEVQAHARFGPLTPADVESPRRTPHQVAIVRGDDDLAGAETRLVGLLSSARHLRPEQAVQVALGQARCATAVAELLRAKAAGGAAADGRVGQVATALDGTARALAVAASAPAQAASLHRGDPRPLLQAGELSRYLRAPGATGGQRETAALVGFARALPDVLTTLFEVARRHTARGHWLVPTHEEASTWARFQVGLRRPPLLAAAGPALTAAHHVRQAVGALGNGAPSRAPAPPARAVLGGPLVEVRRRQPLPELRPPASHPGRRARGR